MQRRLCENCPAFAAVMYQSPVHMQCPCPAMDKAGIGVHFWALDLHLGPFLTSLG